MAEKEGGFVDYCPSIKPTDEKYPGVVKLLKQTGCLEENNQLTKCLKENNKNFAKCSVIVIIIQ
jgi:hypothetical protein